MNKEEWLIQEVDKWEEDALIDVDTGEKIKKQYELYRSFNFNIFLVLFAILGAVLIVSGIGLVSFYSWKTLPSFVKVIIAVFPLLISYILLIYTIIAKYNNKVWKESSAFLNAISVFFALAIIVTEFHFDLSLSQYLIISSLLTLPIMYIMQSVSALVIYYIAILLWGSLNISFNSSIILLGLFLLGAGIIGFNIRNFNKALKFNVCILALAGLPFMILFTKMLNGDEVLASFLYSTLLFAARDIKHGRFHLKLIAMVVSLLTIVYTTLYQTWVIYNHEFGGMILGIVTSLILLASLAMEAFNTKEDSYEFSYLLMLMLFSIVRYIWGCTHFSTLIFMILALIISMSVALGFVALGKARKRIEVSAIGFIIIALIVLIKIFESNLFYVWRAVSFLILGCVSLALVIVLATLKIGNKQDNEIESIREENSDEENINEEGSMDEKDNFNN